MVSFLVSIFTLMIMQQFSYTWSMINLSFLMIANIIFFQYYNKNSLNSEISYLIVFWPLYGDVFFVILMCINIVKVIIKLRTYYRNLESFCFIYQKITNILFYFSLNSYFALILLSCWIDLSPYWFYSLAALLCCLSCDVGNLWIRGRVKRSFEEEKKMVKEFLDNLLKVKIQIPLFLQKEGSKSYFTKISRKDGIFSEVRREYKKRSTQQLLLKERAKNSLFHSTLKALNDSMENVETQDASPIQGLQTPRR